MIANQRIYETIKGLSYNEYINFEDIIETEEFIALIGFVIAGILNAFDALPSLREPHNKR